NKYFKIKLMKELFIQYASIPSTIATKWSDCLNCVRTICVSEESASNINLFCMFPNLKTIHFDSFTKSIEEYKLPESITKIKLYKCSFQNLKTGGLSKYKYLTDIWYEFCNFSKELDPFALPSNLKSLRLAIYNYPLKMNVLPPNLTSLQLFGYNQPLENDVLPPNLLKLFLSNSFDQNLEEFLPSSLTELFFGSQFNRPLRIGILPPNLRRLEF